MSIMRIRLSVSGCVLLAAICLLSISSAQPNWVRTYGETGYAWGNSVKQNSDGGYIIAGCCGPVYLIRTNAQGDTLWTRTYGGAVGGQGSSARQTSDGGFILACSYGDVNLMKTDSRGDSLWTRNYAGSVNCVEPTADGGYILAGEFDTDFYLAKTDAQGDTLWTRSYVHDHNQGAVAVQQTTDGGYIVAGETDTGSATRFVYLLKTNALGDELWARTCGESITEWFNSVQQTSDGGYVVAATTSSAGPGMLDVYLIKTNAQGDTLWTRTYGGTGVDEGASVQQTSDGGYIIGGNTRSFGAGAIDFYLVKTDAQGETLWTRTYGRRDRDDARSLTLAADGDYLMTGYTESVAAPGLYVFLVKTNGELDVGPVAIQSPPGVVDSGISYVPRAVVRNFGLTSGSIVQVTIDIGSGYTETVQETLVSVPLDTVVFPAWTAEPVGTIPITCFTTLVGDEDPANDTIQDSIQVLGSPAHDVGAVAIVSPTGSVRAGDTVIPRATIMNFGNRVERYFDVRFRTGTSYNEKVNVTDALPSGSTAELTFPPWVAEAGNWAVSCSTMLASDVVRANDKVSSSVRVFPQSLSIAPDQSDRIEAGKSKTYQFHALILGDTGGIVEVARPTSPPGWSVRLGNATGANDLTDTDGDAIPDLGYVAPGESGWFSLDVTAPSGTQGDTASLSHGVFLVAGHVGDRPDIADTALLNLALVPTFSVHNFPSPFSGSTTFVVGLPDDGKASLTVYARAGERVCRVIKNADMPAGVHMVRWDGVNDNGRGIAPGTYEYLLDYVHAGKTDRIRKKLVVTRE
jgi:hypothetical protein